MPEQYIDANGMQRTRYSPQEWAEREEHIKQQEVQNNRKHWQEESRRVKEEVNAQIRAQAPGYAIPVAKLVTEATDTADKALNAVTELGPLVKQARVLAQSATTLIAKRPDDLTPDECQEQDAALTRVLSKLENVVTSIDALGVPQFGTEAYAPVLRQLQYGTDNYGQRPAYMARWHEAIKAREAAEGAQREKEKRAEAFAAYKVKRDEWEKRAEAGEQVGPPPQPPA